MGLRGSKESSGTETSQSSKSAREPSASPRQGKVSDTDTDIEGADEEESFYSWSALTHGLDKVVQVETQNGLTVSCRKEPVQVCSKDSSDTVSTVDMKKQNNIVDDLGAQFDEQLRVQEGMQSSDGQHQPKSPGTLTPAESPANPSWETQRTSHGGSDGNQHIVRMSAGTSSARSSFALDHADMLANRKSLEAFHKAYCQQYNQDVAMNREGEFISTDQSGHTLSDADFFQNHALSIDILLSMGLPRELCKEAWMLSVLPSETPAPLSMLSKLWNKKESAAESCMLSLAKLGVLKVAHLPDGNIWGLPQDDFIGELENHLNNESCSVSFHCSLIEGYARDALSRRETCGEVRNILRDENLLVSLCISDILDDGYIVTNLMYHLVGARLDTVVRTLLLTPEWLEKKLLSSGAAPVISDFRRYLMLYRDGDVKLVLEALQLSLGALKNNIIPGLLPSQLAGRLLMAPLSSRLPWMTKDTSSKTDVDDGIVPLKIINPCLDQAGGLQRLCLKGHRGPVTKLALLPSGSEAISASQDGTIRIWDLEIGNCVMTINAHDGPITGLAVTSDASLVVTSSEDGMVRAFALEEGTCLRTFGTPKCPIHHFLLDPFGRFVVTADERGMLCLWDLVSATAIHESMTGSQISSLVLSPCTKYVAVGTDDGNIYGIEIETWKLACSLSGHTAEISGLSVTQNLNRIISSSLDGDIRVWKRDGTTSLVKHNTSVGISSMYVTKAYDRAICGNNDGKAIVWDLKHGNCLKILDGHNGPITCTSMSYNEDIIMTGSVDGTSIAWSADSGEIMRVLEGHSSAILCLEISRKGRFAVTGSEDGSLRVWDFTAVNSHIPHWHAGNIRDLCTGKNGVAVTAGDDCVARIWDSSVGEFLGELKKHSVSIRWCIASEDGSMILTASPNREMYVWNIESREYMYGLSSSPGSRVKSISASGNLGLVVICLFDSTVSLWNLQSGECVWKIQQRGHMTGMHGHTSAVNSVILTRDGNHVITASKDTTVRIWDVQNKTCKHVLREHEDSVVGIYLEPDQGTLVTYALDHTLATWDFETGRKLSRARFKKPISRASICKTGKIAVASSDGTINVISPETGDAKEIRIHASDVTALLFSDDGKVLFTSSTDCSLKMIDLVKERIRGIFIGDCPITSIALHHDTRHIVAGTDRGVVIFLDVSSLLEYHSIPT